MKSFRFNRERRTGAEPNDLTSGVRMTFDLAALIPGNGHADDLETVDAVVSGDGDGDGDGDDDA